MLRLGGLILAAAVITAVVASSAFAALFFLFKPTSARPGKVVTVRLGGTPASFTLADREKPFQRPIRVYLVPNGVAGKVRSRFDPRLHFIGLIVPDRDYRGILTFTAPPIDTGTYAVAAWCPRCARNSFGRTFFVLPIPEVSRFRDQMGLRLELPSAAETCPVTIPRGSSPPPGLGPDPRWHGNGFLWTRLQPSGVFAPGPPSVQPDGSIGTKLFWFAAHEYGTFSLRGQRLDDPTAPRLAVHHVNEGTMTRFRGSGTWATPVTFPSEGCWRLKARVRDISLSYVVKVERS